MHIGKYFVLLILFSIFHVAKATDPEEKKALGASLRQQTLTAATARNDACFSLGKNAIPQDCFYQVLIYAGGEALLASFSVSKDTQKVVSSPAIQRVLDVVTASEGVIVNQKPPLLPSDKEEKVAVESKEDKNTKVSAADKQPQVNRALEGKISCIDFVRAHYCIRGLVQRYAQCAKNKEFFDTYSPYILERISFLRKLGLETETAIFTHMGAGLEAQHPLYLAACAGDLRCRMLYCFLYATQNPLFGRVSGTREISSWAVGVALNNVNGVGLLRLLCSTGDKFQAIFGFGDSQITQNLPQLIHLVRSRFETSHDETFLINFAVRILEGHGKGEKIDQLKQLVLALGPATPPQVTSTLINEFAAHEKSFAEILEKLFPILEGGYRAHRHYATYEDCDLVVGAYKKVMEQKWAESQKVGLLTKLFALFSEPAAPFVGRVALLRKYASRGRPYWLSETEPKVATTLLPSFKHDLEKRSRPITFEESQDFVRDYVDEVRRRGGSLNENARDALWDTLLQLLETLRFTKDNVRKLTAAALSQLMAE